MLERPEWNPLKCTFFIFFTLKSTLTRLCDQSSYKVNNGNLTQSAFIHVTKYFVRFFKTWKAGHAARDLGYLSISSLSLLFLSTILWWQKYFNNAFNNSNMPETMRNVSMFCVCLPLRGVNNDNNKYRTTLYIHLHIKQRTCCICHLICVITFDGVLMIKAIKGTLMFLCV